MLYQGIGCEQNFKRAFHMFEASAQHKHASAQYYLGNNRYYH